MAVQYYTLEEAARLLDVSPDELKMMSRRGELRPFQDRGNLRFRASEVDELGRRRGQRSDPEVPLGEAPRPTKAPSSHTRKSQLKQTSPRDDDDRVDLGVHMVPPDSPSSKSKSGKSSHVAPSSGSDSDVRLVSDGSDINFKVASDSDVKIVDDAPPSSKPPSSKTGSKKPKVPRDQPDSGVRLVLDSPSDSDVKIVPDSGDDVNLGPTKSKTASDSDIRLERVPDPPRGSKKSKKEQEAHLTGEFDLDAELEDSDEQKKLRGGKSSPVLPAKAPSEGSSDFELTPAREDKKTKLGKKSKDQDSSDEFVLSVEDSDLDRSKPSKSDSSDDFDLSLEDSDPSGEVLSQPSSSPVSKDDEPPSSETEESSSEFELSLDASPVEGETVEASSSELELSLEEDDASSDSSSEFELSLDDSGPQPTGAETGADSSGEFELSLDESDAGSSPAEEGTSEFELALDEGSPASATEGPSDSEFDLTMETSPDELEDALAESGGLADLEDSDEKPIAQDKDIFETDFEVPNIEEESDSQAVAMEDSDTDLEETSDFGVALSDDDLTSEDQSGSQVVALEEEEQADDEAATVDRRRRSSAAAVAETEEGLEEFEETDLGEAEEEDLGLEEEAEEEPRRRKAEPVAAAPAKVRWGPLPAIFLLPCVILLFLVGLMTWETLNLMWGNHQGQKVSGVLVPWVASNFNLIQTDGASK